MSVINNLLQPYQRFGIHLGLERIDQLLHNLGNPHENVPIIHVAGTNGKGSVCAYLSAVLKAAGYRVGRYTSPHLIDWTERICINEQPISQSRLVEIIETISANISGEMPTQFEVITAAGWLYFAQEKVDIAVIEVGLGGRLDATNVQKSPLASVITSISFDHMQNLGFTLAEIAQEKAGILKYGCPVILGKLPESAQQVVKSLAESLNCSQIWVEPAETIEMDDSQMNWAKYQDITYPLALAGEIQLLNSAIAIATLKTLKTKGWQISTDAITQGMSQTVWPGRIQWSQWQKKPLLVDGAHNQESAIALRQYVDTLKRPVIWVMGILSTKDHQAIFTALLRESDILYLVPVPDHSSADPETLAKLATSICPQLQECQTYPDLFTALSQAQLGDRLTVLCGSLYLVGYFRSQQLRR